MRSRYVAYVLGDEDYVLDTWHPTTRPQVMNLAEDELTQWTRLNILAATTVGAHDDHGTVQFEAFFIQSDQLCCLTEMSRFQRVDGKWYYVDGQVDHRVDIARKLGRNDPCPCGSGQKYKRCCGKRK